MKLVCPEFKNYDYIPQKFTCEGKNINPTLIIEDIPKGTKSLALVVYDPDAPGGTFVHWLVYDIPVTNKIEEDTIPGKQGSNNMDRKSYGGPCPPRGNPHHYFFKMYALVTELNFSNGIDMQTLEKSVKGKILDTAELIGLYKR
ncbi:MAG: hypothetical protein A2539_08755 [Elusimicrobia bacterium RIFOXYD2_FULL_34_15]|nr:MAG: hypothetical protein A2539_08755 [Elusimicrobia bacterium RIFOXYD2_FULL_34_15]